MSRAGAVLSFCDAMAPRDLIAYAQRLETLGHREMWLPDLLGRDSFALAGFLLAHTTRMRVGTGIANVYGRDALSTAQVARTLSELHEGRFTLGLGVSHPQVAEMRGHVWIPPARKLSGYLAEMSAAELRSPEPEKRAPIYVAAHGPKLLAVAARQADGANTYLMPPEHTRAAREILGSEKLLSVVLPCCLCEDRELAHLVARKGLSMYRSLPAYQRQWARFGFDASDLDNGGSDRWVDSLVAWGSEAAIRARFEAHIDAGADQIVILPYNPERGGAPPWKLLELFAPS